MFNTFLTNILNSYLGEIVEDLDIDNLGSGAINGDILLIDLKLRPDALVRIYLDLTFIVHKQHNYTCLICSPFLSSLLRSNMDALVS